MSDKLAESDEGDVSDQFLELMPMAGLNDQQLQTVAFTGWQLLPYTAGKSALPRVLRAALSLLGL
eukprot:9040164-Alexandrium_andersonii.AAC.1